MTYYDDESCRYIEAESVDFTGPHATHTLLDGFGYVYRANYLMDSAIGRGELPGQRELRGKTELDGMQVRQHGNTATLRSCSIGCGRMITLESQRNGHRRCPQCRKAGRGGRVKAA